MANNLRKYLKILGQLWIFSLLTSLEYRFQTIVRLFRMTFDTLVIFVFIYAFFSKAPVISGWTTDSILLNFGVFTALYSGLYVFLGNSFYDLAPKIRDGMLDGWLLKPADSQFLVSFNLMHPQNTIRTVIGFIIFLYALNRLPIYLDFLTWPLFIIQFISSFAICYSFLSIFATFSFWTYTNDLYALSDTTMFIARYPLDIFPKTFIHLFSIIPLIFVATIITRTLLGERDMLSFISPFLAVVFIIFSRQFFTFALKRYSSASS